VVAILPPAFLGLKPYQSNRRDLFSPPSGRFWLGTDEIGRDLLSRVVVGTKVSLATVGVALAVSVPIGTVVGLSAGYFGGRFDILVMRVVDMWLAFPTILVAIIVVILIGAGPVTPMVAIGFVNIPRFIRVVRSKTIAIREDNFVEAARAVGAPGWYLLLRTLLPNVQAVIFVQMALTAGHAVLMESSLSFLGLGTNPPIPSWGSMLRKSMMYLSHAPWYGLYPGVMITVLIITMNQLADGLKDLYRS
jgi:peptide/nickel transport system permease protein